MPKINFEIFTDVNISPCFGSQIKMLMVDDRSGKFFHLDPLRKRGRVGQVGPGAEYED